MIHIMTTPMFDDPNAGDEEDEGVDEELHDFEDDDDPEDGEY
jgi:hypothetical protein